MRKIHTEVLVPCVSGRLGKCDPELISTVMEYCLQMRCRSEPIFEAVAESFVCSAERHTTLQIAKQIVAMGRLNYLPQVLYILCIKTQWDGMSLKLTCRHTSALKTCHSWTKWVLVNFACIIWYITLFTVYLIIVIIVRFACGRLKDGLLLRNHYVIIKLTCLQDHPVICQFINCLYYNLPQN